jgi:serine/threonine protein kinase, bacterial
MGFTRIASAVMAVVTLGLSGVVSGCASQQTSDGPLWVSRVASATGGPGPRLDGRYRIDTKYSQGTYEGSPIPGGTDVSRWYAFRSTCTAARCTAAATQLDNGDHTEAMPNGSSATLRFTNGRWQTTTPINGTVKCQANPDVRLKTATSLSFRPLPDGTLTGSKFYTELNGGAGACTGTGRTAKYPITLVRDGAVPTGVMIANPPPG